MNIHPSMTAFDGQHGNSQPTPQDLARMARLRAAERRPGEASLFHWDAHFGQVAVKLLPGEYFVSDEQMLITTTLGSCIAACLWDGERQIGGVNHFMLPAGNSNGDSGRYGPFAMQLLIDELLRQGASRQRLRAKIFGGGAVVAGMRVMNVGELNTRFVIDYLQAERIPIISRDVMALCPRKLCFTPTNGHAKVKRLASRAADASPALTAATAATAGPTT